MDSKQELESRAELPPLRIHHFLTWMVVAAVSFAIFHGIYNRVGIRVTAEQVPSFLPLLAQTMATTALGFTLYWCWQGHGMLAEPGQGLLLVTGLNFVGEMTFSFPLLFWPDYYTSDQGSPTEEWIRFLSGWGATAVLLANILIFGLLFVRFRNISAWKTYFLLIAILKLATFLISRFAHALSSVSSLIPRIYSLLHVEFLLPFILEITMVVGLAYLALRDLRSGNRYHWSHWCGLVCALIVGIQELNMSVMQLLMRGGWIS